MGTACCSSRDDHVEKFVNTFKLKTQASNESQPGRDTPPPRRKKVQDEALIQDRQEKELQLLDDSISEAVPQRYTRQFQRRVTLTIANLMHLQAKRKGMERYHYGVVSDFLEVHNADISVIISLISKDVVGLGSQQEWRSKNLPVNKSDLLRVIRTGQIYLYGSDIHRHPCVIIHANYRMVEDGELSSQPLNHLSPQDFVLFLIYALESLPQKLKRTHGEDLDTTHYTLIIDTQKGPFPLDVIQQIAELDARHYPMRISHIHVINLNPRKFTSEDAARVKNNPVFNSRGRIHTDQSELLVDFERDKLPERLGGVCPSIYKYSKTKDVDELMIALVK